MKIIVKQLFLGIVMSAVDRLTMHSSFRRNLAVYAAAAMLVLAGAANATADSLAGASANGSASGSFSANCTTCSSDDLVMSGTPSQIQGGTGSASAMVSYNGAPTGYSTSSAPYTMGGGAGYAAQAYFEGAAATPVVRSRAAADNVPVPDLLDPAIFVGVDTYRVYSNATAIQRYTYTGSVSGSYSFTFAMDGSLTGSPAHATASAGFYDEFGAFEIPMMDAFDNFISGSVSADGPLDNTSYVDQAFTLTATFAPGMSFYLKTSMDTVMIASILSSEDGNADFFSTFRVTNINGDLGLLQYELPGQPTAPVPEPATMLLVGTGLAGLAAIRRKKKA